MQKTSWILAFSLLPFLACTHTQNQDISSNCSWETAPSEPSWIFLNCRVKNQTEKTLAVSFKPQISEADENLEEPSSGDLAALQERLRKRAAAPTAPQFIGAGNSGAPEAFAMQTLAGLSMMLMKTSRYSPSLSTGDEFELKAGQSTTILFPLRGSKDSKPSTVSLHFKKPLEELRAIEIEKDPGDLRRRPR